MIFLFLAIFFIIAQGFFGGMETGLVSLRKARLRQGVESKLKRAMILDFFISHPRYMLATILLGSNICIVCGALCAKKAVAFFGFTDSSSIFITTIIMTFLLLMIEIIPKDWFRQAPYERCYLFAHILNLSYYILILPVKILSAGTKIIENKFISHKSQNLKDDTSSDLKLLLRESAAENIIDSEAVGIIEKSLDFYKFTINDIIIKKQVVFDVKADMKIIDAIEFCRKNNVSRVPIYNQTYAKWIGFFSIYDAFYKLEEDKWQVLTVSHCMRTLPSIKSNASVSEILTGVNISKSPIVAIVDKDSDIQIGIITKMDAVKCLF